MHRPTLATLAGAAALAVAALLAACSKTPDSAWSGYVEGDYVYVSSPVGGTLDALSVRRGQQVSAGAPLFALDAENEQAARDQAAALVAAAKAQARDAEKGRRPPEIAMTQAQLSQATAQARLADSEYARQQALRQQGFISQAALDDARTAAEQAHQHVAELTAALKVAKLPARSDAQAAAQANAKAAAQALRQTEWRTGQTRQAAPTAAEVADTFFRVGEWVPAGQPVVSLLPPGQVRARFFVPEGELGALQVGDAVRVECDGCGQPIAAHVDFVATQAEYTPPVIYSNAQRARLVFRVEARPDDRQAAQRLKPGQPVDVVPADRKPGTRATAPTGASDAKAVR